MTAHQARRALPETELEADPVLPSKDELLAALRGHYLDGPLCAEAHALAELHRARRGTPARAAEFDGYRRDLVRRIDSWVRRNLPAPRPGVRRHPETLGAVIDRMAAASARAFDLLMTIDPGSDEMHAAWTALAEQEIGYGEVVAALERGWLALPPR
ncbi:DUF4254 domain-containing protein [Nocardia sp. NPDC057353]|uniref:DUF4254 domain-containing protein n=1 Tax=Nocardia sp. NPDC057353 TaxID=3346104 RepID=UPI0036459631